MQVSVDSTASQATSAAPSIALLEPPPLSLLPLPSPQKHELFAFASHGSVASRYLAQSSAAAAAAAATTSLAERRRSSTGAASQLGAEPPSPTDSSSTASSSAPHTLYGLPHGSSGGSSVTSLGTADGKPFEEAKLSPRQATTRSLRFLRRPSYLALGKVVQWRRTSGQAPLQQAGHEGSTSPTSEAALAPFDPQKPSDSVRRAACVANLIALEVRGAEDQVRALLATLAAPPEAVPTTPALLAAQEMAVLIEPAKANAVAVTSPTKRAFGWFRRARSNSALATLQASSPLLGSGEDSPSHLVTAPGSIPGSPSLVHQRQAVLEALEAQAKVEAAAQINTLQTSLQKSSEMLEALQWRWGGAAQRAWGVGCGRRYMAEVEIHTDDHVSAAEEEGDVERQSSRRDSANPNSSSSGGGARRGSDNASNSRRGSNKSDDSSSSHHQASTSPAQSVAGSARRRSSQQTEDLMPPGSPALRRWQGFNMAYSRGSIDLDVFHPIPAGVPDFTTCKDATPLSPGTYSPLTPIWESERLRALWRLSLHNLTPRSVSRVQELVHECATYLGLSEGRLTFFDRKGSVFIMTTKGLQPLEALRENLICSHAILNRNNGVMVLDCAGDWRFESHAPGIRFYIGMPVLSSSGMPVAVLSFFDTVPWSTFRTDQRIRVRETARTIGGVFEEHHRQIWETKVVRMTKSYETLTSQLEDVSWASRRGPVATLPTPSFGVSSSLLASPSTVMLSPGPYTPGLSTHDNPIDLEALVDLGVLLTLEDVKRLTLACKIIAEVVDLPVVYLAAVTLNSSNTTTTSVESPSSEKPSDSPAKVVEQCLILAAHGLSSYAWPALDPLTHARPLTSQTEPFLVFQNDCDDAQFCSLVEGDAPSRCGKRSGTPTFSRGILVSLTSDAVWRAKDASPFTDSTEEAQQQSPKLGFVLAAMSLDCSRSALGLEDLRYLQSLAPLLTRTVGKAMDAADAAANWSAAASSYITETGRSTCPSLASLHTSAAGPGIAERSRRHLSDGAKRCGQAGSRAMNSLQPTVALQATKKAASKAACKAASSSAAGARMAASKAASSSAAGARMTSVGAKKAVASAAAAGSKAQAALTGAVLPKQRNRHGLSINVIAQHSLPQVSPMITITSTRSSHTSWSTGRREREASLHRVSSVTTSLSPHTVMLAPSPALSPVSTQRACASPTIGAAHTRSYAAELVSPLARGSHAIAKGGSATMKAGRDGAFKLLRSPPSNVDSFVTCTNSTTPSVRSPLSPALSSKLID